jgi:hypothetical protein
MFRASVARGDLEAAYRLYDTLSDPEPRVILILASALIEAKSFDLVDDLLGKDGGRLDPEDANDILNALALANQPESCSGLLRSSRNFPIGDSTYKALVSVFRCAHSSLALISSRGSNLAKNSAVRALAADGDMTGAMLICEYLIQNDQEVEQETLEVLIDYLARRGDMASAEKILEILLAMEMTPNADLLTSLLIGIKTSGQGWVEGERIFKDFIALGIEAPSEALEAVADLLPIENDSYWNELLCTNDDD